MDDEGRIIRSKADQSNRASSGSDWDDFNAWDAPPKTATPSSTNGQKQERGAWDDFDPLYKSDNRKPDAPRGRGGDKRRNDGRGGSDNRSNWSSSSSRSDRGGDRGTYSRNDGERRGADRRGGERRSGDRNTSGYGQSRGDKGDEQRTFRGGAPARTKEPEELKINMRALEGAGFVHLYGLASCVNALQANRRDFTRPEELIKIDELEGEDLALEMKQRARKPEAQFSPWLFVQDQATSKRTGDKALTAELLVELAKERRIPIATVDKGVLNALSGNRPHQGYVLRCGKLDFETITSLPLAEKRLWLCLDEVVDPQNLGALVRSAYFLSADDIGIIVCAKNSAPPSAVVSAASAGALELAQIYATSNLPRLLTQAQENGFRVVGASSSVPTVGSDAQVFNLNELPHSMEPTILVLGSEGYGLRTLVAKACTNFVSIPGGSGAGVDSLNVSVTGGILLWHLLNNSNNAR
jgi:21S rRNA (GM2251-2'-O)-methyltransferase